MSSTTKTMYEIGKDLVALYNLLETIVDEDGNPREPTEEEYETLKEWFTMSNDEFEKKFDNYCKFIKNQKISAEIATSEYKSFKAEIDRLSKRAKASENRAKRLQDLLMYNMSIIKTEKFKTSLFSASIQEGKMSISSLEGFDMSKVPEEYLKPRELDTQAIKKAIDDGTLILGKDIPGTPLIKHSHVYDAKTKKEIPGVYWHKTPFLVIR